MKTYKKHPLALVVASLCATMSMAQADDQVIAGPDSSSVIQFNPQLHDHQKNTIIVGLTDGTKSPGRTYNAGAVVNIQTLNKDIKQSFLSGDAGNVYPKKTLAELYADGKLIDPNGLANKDRLNLGNMVHAITVPDPITGGVKTIQTYDDALFNDPGFLSLSNVAIDDVHDVNGDQYIDLRIAEIEKTGGILNVDMGDKANKHTDSTNNLTLAAKQSTLFEIDGSGGVDSIINWDTNNRVYFNAASASATDDRSYTATNYVDYLGKFSVTTIDGQSYDFDVTDMASLQAYNNFLRTELGTGNLEATSYKALFNKAAKISSGQIYYEITAGKPGDEIFEGQGERLVIHAKGANAQANINAILDIEVGASNVNQSGVLIEDGAHINISENGLLGSRNNQALSIKNGASGINDGVINGNFTTKGVTHTASGKLADGSVQVDGRSQGMATAVNLEASKFTNNGVLNLNSAYANSPGTAIGIDLKNGSEANNTGAINVGVVASSQNNTTLGVRVFGASDKFINSGEIYIGRGPQSNKDDATASTEIALNQLYTTMGIRVDNNGTASNTGDIIIGSKVQNAAAMGAISGDDVVMVNRGNIIINGNAATVPNMNFGMLISDSGANQGIKNEGNITLSGANAIGIQILSTDNKQAYASTTSSSKILIEGQANPNNDTRNYGVWVEGQGSGQSSADVDGDIILRGDGAIGVHARGNAIVKVHANSVPKLESGEKQVAFFAYGDNANIEVGGAQDFDVSTKESTFFRMEDGADFKEGGLILKTSAQGAVGINGTGIGTEIDLTNGSFVTSGEQSTALIIEGGATGKFDAGTTIKQSGNQSTAVVVDGAKHNLAGKELSSGNASIVESSAKVSSQGSAANLIGYDVKNGGALIQKGSIDYTAGTDHIAIKLSGANAAKPSKVQNEGTIHVNHGTGIDADGKGTSIIKGGTINVDDGVAGIRLTNGAKATIVDGSSNIKTNGTAHGIFLDKASGTVGLGNTTIDILGSGNGIENTAEIGDITIADSVINVKDGSGIRTATQINPSSATINVSGEGSGFGFKKVDGSTTDKDLTLSEGYTINVLGSKGIGIEALTTGTVTTKANVVVTSPSGGPALLAGTAKESKNLGTLISLSSTPVVDLTNGSGTMFANEGTITAKDVNSLAVQGSMGDDTLTFSQGSVRGEINSGAGKDFILFNGGTLEGGISMEGSNSTTHIQGVDLSTTYHVQAKTGNNTLVLENVVAKGGSFAQDDLTKGVNLNTGWDVVQLTNNTVFTLTDNLKLEGSIVNIDGSSTLFAGNNVQPIISASDPSKLMIINTGIIDLTNGNAPVDTLTIKGNYSAVDPSTTPSPFTTPLNAINKSILNINTDLNTGGALSNQRSDRLLIESDVTGTTNIFVTPSGAGAITDVNRDGIVQNNEGISIVQVGGSSAANAFILGSPVLAGAYAYELYSFAPGSANSAQRLVAGNGNTFWDYRLANDFACPIGEVCFPQPVIDPTNPGGGMAYAAPHNARYKLTPQMPAYISLPSAIADYNNVIADDLHKRLGEVRHDQTLGNKNSGKIFSELFVRYIGAQTKYKSNVAFKNYGYDYDLNINAMQVGMNLFKFNTNTNDIFRGGFTYTHGQSVLKPKSSDGYSKTKIDSDTFAMYLTWQKENGFYLDGVLAYNQHKANVETRQFFKRDQSIKAKGWLASIETGYPIHLKNDFVIEPQAQLTYQSVKVKNFKDLNGANLRYDDYAQTTVRLGVRGYKTWVTKNGNQHTPYVRLNYYHNLGGGAKLKVSDQFNYPGQGDNFIGGKRGNAVQLGLGVTSTFTNNLSLFGEVDYQKNLGSHGSKGLRLNLGAKWVF